MAERKSFTLDVWQGFEYVYVRNFSKKTVYDNINTTECYQQNIKK